MGLILIKLQDRPTQLDMIFINQIDKTQDNAVKII